MSIWSTERYGRLILMVLACVNITNVQAQEVVTSHARQVTVPELRVVDATIEAVHSATVSAQTAGRITEITVDVDDYVAKGEVIIRMRDKEQRAAFNAAKAGYEEAQAEHRRVTEIFEKKLVAKAMLDKAEARLQSARARLEQAQEALEHTLVRAPYSGIVVKRHVEVGETARVGQPLMTGLSLEKLRASVNLPQSLVHDVRKFQKAWVWVGKNMDKKVEASSLTISPFADTQSHTFLVRVNLSATDLDVYPGMHTRVAFLTGESQKLVIPASAVVRRSEVTGVYVKGKDGNIMFRHIRVGMQVDEGQIEVLAGLQADEEVMLDTVKATRLRESQDGAQAENRNGQ